MTDYPLPEGISVLRDVVHTRIEGYRPLSLDVYRPEAGARALCVYVHGGGWRLGSRRAGPGPTSPTSARLLARLAGHGLAVASVDYRLSGEARFPAQLDDVRAACHWLLDDNNAETSGAIGLPLTLFGVSAGGQLAALCGLDPALPARAVAAWYPVTDLLAMPDDLDLVDPPADRSPGSREAMLLGAPAADVPERARSASPVSQVRADAPPFLLLHGDDDHAVPWRQSERLHQALTAAGTRSTLELVPGYDHMFRGIPDVDLDALVDRTATFLLGSLA